MEYITQTQNETPHSIQRVCFANTQNSKWKAHIFNKAWRHAWSKNFQKGFPVDIITIPLLIHIILVVKTPLPFTTRLNAVLSLIKKNKLHTPYMQQWHTRTKLWNQVINCIYPAPLTTSPALCPLIHLCQDYL